VGFVYSRRQAQKTRKRYSYVYRARTDYDNRHEAQRAPCAFLGDRERINDPEMKARSTGPNNIGSFFLRGKPGDSARSIGFAPMTGL
jgi:hypothetical protein